MAFVMAGLRGMNAFAERRPLGTAVVVTGAKAGVADLMVQLLVERRETVDPRRTLLFTSFGASYQGMWQYFMYNKLFERIWPGRTWGNTIAKIAASNLISDPVFFFPTFYTFREVCNTGELGPQSFTNGLHRYSQNYFNDWLNSWAIWVPGYTVTYAVMPTHLRMPWIAGVSFGYVCLLSLTRGAYQEEAGELEDAAAAAPLIPLAAAAAPKKYSADDAKQAIAGIKAGRKALDGIDALLAKGDFDGAAAALAPIDAFEDQATIIIQAPVLAAEDKKAIGTIRRYGVAADVIIMAGGLKEALRDEDARGAKSYLAKCKGSLDEVISIAKGGGLR
ncbi:hypothetical protein AURANDRAFT_68360 [Aureococcus anophagefferens]|uniref:Uncharacterized protein n=1 Tax=Aureococcus anophagefferens TaxID=44056 RepID=F0YPD1_AURAN|nr:hypothetical protein AURANDRAFT_68360 [Aureococcus anophagefferens]EGB03032.1 hypothetical protein AURANDRAFT_68360 [Aureococcus anophagefferens]|eukprot:XP_009042273.1 hypothetical protein AURANDRAFT_68360 [Aureococcus anophagefferens]